MYIFQQDARLYVGKWKWDRKPVEFSQGIESNLIPQNSLV